LQPVVVEAPFQQWGLDFIEILMIIQVMAIHGLSQQQITLKSGLNPFLQSQQLKRL
jgi:hypothetical protein